MTKIIFSYLPTDIIKYILLFDEHFIMRTGKIMSIISKTDNRYNLLKYITLKKDYIENIPNIISTKYAYYFSNLYNYEGRMITNSDLIQVYITEVNNIIRYKIWIGRQKPKYFITNKTQNFYIENPIDYHWVYTEYEYVRR
jgi:hypothetical protein